MSKHYFTFRCDAKTWTLCNDENPTVAGYYLVAVELSPKEYIYKITFTYGNGRGWLIRKGKPVAWMKIPQYKNDSGLIKDRKNGGLMPEYNLQPFSRLQQWILCEDKLPDDFGFGLVVYDHSKNPSYKGIGFGSYKIVYFNKKRWREDEYPYQPTAWMPIPEFKR